LKKLETEIANKDKELAQITKKIDVANKDLLTAEAEAHRVDVELAGLRKEKQEVSDQIEELKTLLFALGKLTTTVVHPFLVLAPFNGSITIRK
jgi:predicted  nucleic acid-binding Zn-ribbon protein